MSKNFELLQNISNEKDLFQTLDDWENVAEESVAWVKPKIGPELGDAVELEWGPERLLSGAIPESGHASDRPVGSSFREVLEPSRAKDEKTHYEPPRQRVFRSI